MVSGASVVVLVGCKVDSSEGVLVVEGAAVVEVDGGGGFVDDASDVSVVVSEEVSVDGGVGFSDGVLVVEDASVVVLVEDGGCVDVELEYSGVSGAILVSQPAVSGDVHTVRTGLKCVPGAHDISVGLPKSQKKNCVQSVG